MTFAQQIRAARERLHVTQSELAGLLVPPVDKQTVSNWECERSTPHKPEAVLVQLETLDPGVPEIPRPARQRVSDRL